MIKKKTGYIRVAIFCLMVISADVAYGQFGAGPGKARVSLVSSVDSVVSGGAFDVAIHFKLQPGWHIYWHNSGDSGQPPRVTWKLPTGFQAGDLQYPVPKRYHSAGNITTNILENDPGLIVRITSPSKISAKRVTIAADIRYLICKDTCLLEKTEVKLVLPIVSNSSAVTFTHNKEFKQWQSAQPNQTSKYVTMRSSLSPVEPKLGEMFEYVVNVQISSGYHIQSHEPTMPGLVGCDLFVRHVQDVYFEKTIYPKPKIRQDSILGELSEYEGNLEIRVPAEMDEEAVGPFDFGGVFVFQACDNKGHCFPPESVSFFMNEKSQDGLVATSVILQAHETIAGSTNDSDKPAGLTERFGLAGLLFFCFIYGLFINATPCVLPLLSIKVLGFVQQAHESRSRTLMLGLSFGVGVMLFFVILGLLASTGKNILQFPIAVIVLGAVVMALSLSMLGVYTLQVPTSATNLEASIQKEGIFSSFAKGALAPVLGFACTGPLLAGAFGWATQQPPHIAIIAFLITGFGMASPYMLLGANPNWLSFLPKPGNWMITFERVMGFLLIGMVILLIHPLITQIGPEGLEWTLAFFVVIAMACWILGKVTVLMPAMQRLRYRGSALAMIAVSAFLIYGVIYPIGDAMARVKAERMASGSSSHDWTHGIPWRHWNAEEVAETVRSGKMVFVDFTAAYCTNCKVNKKVAINTETFQNKMKEYGVVPFKGDNTTVDPEITAMLRKYNRPGVPLNLIYPAGKPDTPILLNTLMTKQYLLDKLDEAYRLGSTRASN